jgi:hypothetical protein
MCVQITLLHLNSVKDIVKDSNLKEQVESIIQKSNALYSTFDEHSWLQLRATLARFLKDKRVKVGGLVPRPDTHSMRSPKQRVTCLCLDLFRRFRSSCRKAFRLRMGKCSFQSLCLKTQTTRSLEQ